MKVVAVLTATVVVALAAAGAASAAPTKRDFIRKGDAACAAVIRELAPIRRRAQAAQSLPEEQKWRAAAALWRDQVAIQARFNTRFRAIGTPVGDTAARQLVAGLDRGLVLARRVSEGFVRRDVRALSSALPAYVSFTLALNRRVHAYGFRVCGRS